jgi:ABC-type transporter Mla MlaB component
MLKITTQVDEKATTLALVGRLAGPWTTELETCWKEASLCKPPRLRVDLTNVTYIDDRGKAILARMHQDGAELIASGCLTRCIVEDIMRATLSQAPRSKR